MKKSSLVLLSILGIAGGAAVSEAQDKFPSSPIRFILPVRQALNSPKVIETYAKQNIRSRPTASLEEAKTWLQGEVARWQKIIKKVKIDITD